MRPDQAEFLLRFLLPQLKSEQAVTKKIVSAVPRWKASSGLPPLDATGQPKS